MSEASDKVLLILIGVVITTLFQFLNTWLTKKSEKSIKHKDQLKLLSSELDDLIRHCIANLEVLKSIDLENGVPSIMHFEKMRVMESSIIFSSDTYLLIESKYTGYIHRLKLEIRNINIEINAVLLYLSRPAVTRDILKEYIDYLIFKMDITVNNLPSRLAELTTIDRKVLDKINKYKEENKKPGRRIIYDASFPN